MIDIAIRPLPFFWPAPLAEDFFERLGKIEIPWHFGHGVDRVDLAKAAANDEVGAPASRGVSITSCMLAGRARCPAIEAQSPIRQCR